jgi:hypothetical protein
MTSVLQETQGTTDAAALLASRADAEDGGAGHYMPGGMASFIDAFPGKPGAFAVMNVFTYYAASASAGRALPLGGCLSAGIAATADGVARRNRGVWRAQFNELRGPENAGASPNAADAAGHGTNTVQD